MQRYYYGDSTHEVKPWHHLKHETNVYNEGHWSDSEPWFICSSSVVTYSAIADRNMMGWRLASRHWLGFLKIVSFNCVSAQEWWFFLINQQSPVVSYHPLLSNWLLWYLGGGHPKKKKSICAIQNLSSIENQRPLKLSIHNAVGKGCYLLNEGCERLKIVREYFSKGPDISISETALGNLFFW